MKCNICKEDTFGLVGEGTGEYCWASVQKMTASGFKEEPHKFEYLPDEGPEW